MVLSNDNKLQLIVTEVLSRNGERYQCLEIDITGELHFRSSVSKVNGGKGGLLSIAYFPYSIS